MQIGIHRAICISGDIPAEPDSKLADISISVRQAYTILKYIAILQIYAIASGFPGQERFLGDQRTFVGSVLSESQTRMKLSKTVVRGKKTLIGL